MSSPPRVLVPGARLVAGERVMLPDAESRHLRVTRVRPGEEIVLLDGAGVRAEALLSGDGREAVVQGLSGTHGEPSRRVTVLLGVGELARVEWAVEKGTECGAARFVLVAAARSQRPHVVAVAAKLDRLRRIAAEAVKQCDRSVVPWVLAPQSLAAALGLCVGPLFVARPGAPRLAAAAAPGLEAAVAVGPEGGFDAGEELLLDGAGAVPFGLGSRILRLETAVVAALVRLVDDDTP
ncbi:MAG: 16S rRNA (uracil(1498)-N(3))-methyltransferase [Holophagales bacterium]|nr:16S rRNA (uracil(1498)-N(3))-methyltransferase [Holophagales bacterium]